MNKLLKFIKQIEINDIITKFKKKYKDFVYCTNQIETAFYHNKKKLLKLIDNCDALEANNKYYL